MEPNFQTSFIPKKPIVAERVPASSPIGLLTILSIFFLVAIILATGGLYLYKASLVKSIAQKQNDLILAKNRFEPSKIAELQVLDKRLRASKEILGSHIAITPVFEALSAMTMQTVRYTQFDYNLGTEANPKVNIKMSGQAVGYRSVALQSDLFEIREEGKNFIDPIFSNLKLDNSGNVLFDLEFSVDPSFVNYKQLLLAQVPSEIE